MAGAPKIKHCGMTNVADASAAVESGAWALGMIFWPGSPRACELEQASEISAELRRRVELCGVFVNATLEHVTGVCEAAALSMVQLHGDEGPAYCAEVARRTGAKVAKAVRVRSREQLQALAPFHTDLHLLDAHVPGLLGGTGQTIDWQLVRARHSDVPVVLSGGLTAENVGEAIAVAQPFAVDVASGTEAAPGRKDHAKLHAFGEAVAATAPAEPAPVP
jgi:phosphoribosylanthranilate isomerase